MRFRKVVTLLVICLVATLTAQPRPPAPYLTITPTPPKDLPANASLEQAAKFAWQEFLALQWKAAYDPAKSGPGNQRGLPDLTWNYSKPVPAFPNPLVWQTYAQTTELRPNSPLTTPWQNLGIPKYSYAKPPVPGNRGASFTLWNNLDEDSEIGSCNLYGQYTNQKKPKELVLFQVKVNRDEYEYLRVNFGADQNSPTGKLAQAQNSVKKLVSKPPYLYYPGQTSRCNCPPAQAICLPCGNNAPGGAEGAIEVKSAWRRLQPGDNPARFYTTTALYYDVNANGQLAYYNDTFALIGIHIIHKTVNYPEFIFATFEQVDVERADMEYILTAPLFNPPPGAPKLKPGTEVPPPVKVVRQTGQTNKQQMHPVPPVLDQVTQRVRQQLVALNPSVVWQYYRLTGVQAGPVDAPVPLQGAPPSTVNCIQKQNPVNATNRNPNYFMANFVIESDPFLNNFTGPGFGANGGPIFTASGTTGCENLVAQQKPLTIGGCQGCHGVAQTAFGTDFSFLLDFGNNKPSIMPAAIHYQPPAGQPRRASARKYMQGAVK